VCVLGFKGAGQTAAFGRLRGDGFGFADADEVLIGDVRRVEGVLGRAIEQCPWARYRAASGHSRSRGGVHLPAQITVATTWTTHHVLTSL